MGFNSAFKGLTTSSRGFMSVPQTFYRIAHCAMAQVFSSRPLITEVRVQSQISARGICDGKSATRTGLLSNISVSLYHYHLTNAP